MIEPGWGEGGFSFLTTGNNVKSCFDSDLFGGHDLPYCNRKIDAREQLNPSCGIGK